MRSSIFHICEDVDQWAHEHERAAKLLPFRRSICDAADVSYGWGPDAIDWHRARRLARWLHRRMERS